MALSKDYTLSVVRGILILWMKTLNVSLLDPDLVNDFINVAVMNIFSELQDNIFKDYGRTTTIVDSGAAFQPAAINGETFTDATKTIKQTAHGLTSADIGKRIIFLASYDATAIPAYLTISSIASIVDANNFTVLHSPGVNIPVTGSANKLYYAVIPAHSSDSLDLSALRINRVRKLKDSISGECVEVADARDFENLSQFPQKQNNIYWYQNGETIQLYKGSKISAYGTLTLDYYGKPISVVQDTDYLDIKDEYVPLVIQKAQNYIISHLTRTGQQIPVTNNVGAIKQAETIEEKKDSIKK